MYKFNSDLFKSWAKEKGFMLKLISNFGMIRIVLHDAKETVISSGAGTCIGAAIAHCAKEVFRNKENIVCLVFCENI